MEEKTEEKLTVQKLEEVRDKFVEWVKEKMPNSCQNLDELKNLKFEINEKHSTITVYNPSKGLYHSTVIPNRHHTDKLPISFVETLSDTVKNYKRDSHIWEIKNSDVKIDALKGNFFEDATTYYMSNEFANENSDNIKFKEYWHLKEDFNFKVIQGLAGKLGITPIKLCELINKKHSLGDSSIDRLCERVFGDKNAFERIETSLDYFYAVKNFSAYKLDKFKKDGLNEITKNANTLLKYSINKIFNQSEFGQQLLNENLLETTEPNNLKEEKNKKKRRMGFFARIRNWFFGRKKKNKNNENQATGAVAETAHIKKVGKSELADAKREMANREPESILQEVINKRNEIQSSESSSEKQLGEND